jgi:hypothetical protein
MGLGLPVTLASKVALGGGALALDDLKGSIGGGAVSGNLRAGLKDGVPDLAGTLSADNVDLALAADMLFGDQALQGKDHGWPKTPFSARPQPAFTGDLDLTVRTLQAGRLAMVHDAKLKASLSANGLNVSNLTAKVAGGSLSGLFELRNNGGTGLFTGQVNLQGADLAQLLAGTGLGGSADLSASVTANGKSVDAMVASLAGSGTSSFRNLTVPGVDTEALPAILAGADRIGKDIDAGKTAAFAPAIVSGGTFAAGKGELAFTIAEGVLRAPPLRLEGKGAVVTVTPSFDFNKMSAAASGEIAYQPGDEVLVGSEPDVDFAGSGRLGDMEFKLNTGPLAQFLTQRALEREEARVEAMQAALLEKQRLRREAAYYEDRDATRKREEEEARERAAAEAAAKAAAEAEAARQAEEARQKAEEEAKEKAAEEARAAAAAKAEEEAKAAAAAKAAEEAREKAEEEAKQKAEEEAKQKAAAEAAAKAEEEAKRAAAEKAAADAARKAEEEAQKKAVEDAEKARNRKEEDQSLEDRIQKLLNGDKPAERSPAPAQAPGEPNAPAAPAPASKPSEKSTKEGTAAEKPARRASRPEPSGDFKDLPGVTDFFRQGRMSFGGAGAAH